MPFDRRTGRQLATTTHYKRHHKAAIFYGRFLRLRDFSAQGGEDECENVQSYSTDKLLTIRSLQTGEKRCKRLKNICLELEDRCSIQLSYGHFSEENRLANQIFLCVSTVEL
ncbi:MAG TPA: hypothetical protein VK961_27815 [Chthoniobacter sp.]|nr:hypothetical protein [Chthoniobacter sp.]